MRGRTGLKCARAQLLQEVAVVHGHAPRGGHLAPPLLALLRAQVVAVLAVPAIPPAADAVAPIDLPARQQTSVSQQLQGAEISDPIWEGSNKIKGVNPCTTDGEGTFAGRNLCHMHSREQTASTPRLMLA